MKYGLIKGQGIQDLRVHRVMGEEGGRRSKWQGCGGRQGQGVNKGYGRVIGWLGEWLVSEVGNESRDPT